MTPTEQVAAARAEIANRRAEMDYWEQRGAVDPQDYKWLLGVLADADSTLDRHARETQGGWANACVVCDDDPWPCPDALAVIARYAPQADA